MIHRFIAIEGNIGAGKTSLSHLIGNRLNAKLVLEQFEENSFLPKFYNNPEKYSFPLELSFLAERYQQLKTIESTKDIFSKYLVADYFIYKCLIFAQANLPNEEFLLYRQFFNIVISNLVIPDLLIYLYLTPDNLLNNISKRGRIYETQISEQYLSKINQGYFNFLSQFVVMHPCKVLILDINNCDFVNNSQNLDKIYNAINTDYDNGINRIIL